MKTWYVATSGHDSDSGDIGHPFGSIQHAVNVAADGDTISVAPGTYIRGGGVDPAGSQYPSAIGMVGRRLTITGDRAVIDGQNQFRACYWQDSTVVFKGFRLQNCLASLDGNGLVDSWGGAVYSVNSNLSLADLLFRECMSAGRSSFTVQGGLGVGGGLAMFLGSLNATRLRFDTCTTYGGGGGKYGNYAQGGAICTSGTDVMIYDLIAFDCLAIAGSGPNKPDGMTPDGQGGAFNFIGPTNGLSKIALSKVVATYCQARGGNGDFAGGGFGGAIEAERCDLTLTDSLIGNNTAQGGTGRSNVQLSFGGGLSCTNGKATIVNSRFTGNIVQAGTFGTSKGSAGAGGVGFQNFQGFDYQQELDQCVIAGNTSKLGPITGTEPNGGGGGGLWVQGTQATLNATIIDGNILTNSNQQGMGAVLVSDPINATSLKINGGTVSNHQQGNGPNSTAALWPQSGTEIVLSKANLWMNSGGDVGAGNVIGMETCTSHPPRFFFPGIPYFDYRVQTHSGWLPVIYDDILNLWFVASDLQGGPPMAMFRYGLPQWKPMIGDWNGTGDLGIGMYDAEQNRYYLRNTPTPGPTDYNFVFGTTQAAER